MLLTPDHHNLVNKMFPGWQWLSALLIYNITYMLINNIIIIIIVMGIDRRLRPTPRPT